MRHFEEAQNKAMKTHAQIEKYHTIVQNGGEGIFFYMGLELVKVYKGSKTFFFLFFFSIL